MYIPKFRDDVSLEIAHEYVNGTYNVMMFTQTSSYSDLTDTNRCTAVVVWLIFLRKTFVMYLAGYRRLIKRELMFLSEIV